MLSSFVAMSLKNNGHFSDRDRRVEKRWFSTLKRIGPYYTAIHDRYIRGLGLRLFNSHLHYRPTRDGVKYTWANTLL